MDHDVSFFRSKLDLSMEKFFLLKFYSGAQEANSHLFNPLVPNPSPNGLTYCHFIYKEVLKTDRIPRSGLWL